MPLRITALLLQTPIVDADGLVTRPWARALQAEQQGSTPSGDFELLSALISAATAPQDTQQDAQDAIILSQTGGADGDAVHGASNLNTAGAIPKVTVPGYLGESSLSDDGSVVSGTEPLHIDTGATPQDSQVTLKANGSGVLSLWTGSADLVEASFDNEIVAGVRIARATSCFTFFKTTNTLSIYGKTGATIDAPVTQNLLATIDLATGNIDTAGVYKVAGSQVVQARGAALTAATAYGGGIAGPVYTVAEQALLNALITQVINLKTRLDEVDSRISAAVGHGLIA